MCIFYIYYNMLDLSSSGFLREIITPAEIMKWDGAVAKCADRIKRMK